VGASVAAGASVVAGATVAAGASVAAGACVAAAPPQAVRTMLANTSNDRKVNRFRFTFLLHENLDLDTIYVGWEKSEILG
jgi:hypothetical protein